MAMTSSLSFDFQHFVSSRRSLIEERLKQYLAATDPPRLWESMRYSVLGGGKRMRAILCLAAAEAVSGTPYYTDIEGKPVNLAAETVLPCACALEMVHAMSLIHDDMPCMDNDDFRRGQPTNHKVYGEAMALLAGDALLVYALEVLLQRTPLEVDRNRVIRTAIELSKAAGAHGMVGGQVADMELTDAATSSTHLQQQNASVLQNVHMRKTGALLRFSTWSGACLMGAGEDILDLLGEFGQTLGLAFQIQDDLLDVTGDLKTLGKTPGKDEASGKMTWVSFYGVEGSRQKLNELEEKANDLLDKSGLASAGLLPLRSLLTYTIRRSH